MRSIIILLALTLGASAAAAQVVRSGAGSADQNTTGRSVIPEKIGKPLQRGLVTSDVRLRPGDDPFALPSAPHARPRPRVK